MFHISYAKAHLFYAMTSSSTFLVPMVQYGKIRNLMHIWYSLFNPTSTILIGSKRYIFYPISEVSNRLAKYWVNKAHLFLPITKVLSHLESYIFIYTIIRHTGLDYKYHPNPFNRILPPHHLIDLRHQNRWCDLSDHQLNVDITAWWAYTLRYTPSLSFH